MTKTNQKNMGKKKRQAASKLREEGNEHFNEGGYTEAIKKYTESLDKYKTSTSYANRAQAYINVGKFEKALRDAQAALSLDPKNEKARYRLALALARTGKPVEATIELNKCMEQKHTEPKVQQLAEELAASNVKHEDSFSSTEPSYESAVFEDLCFIGTPMRILLDGKLIHSLEFLYNILTEINQAKPFDLVILRDIWINNELMEFFRSMNHALWKGGCLEFLGNKCTEVEFMELFGGDLFRPLIIHLGAMHYVEYSICEAFNRLAAFREAKHVVASALDYQNKDFLRPVAYGLSVEVGSLVHLLHTHYSGFGSMRFVEVDMNCVKGKSAQKELMNFCITRFMADKRSVSYRLKLRCHADVPLNLWQAPQFRYNSLGEMLQIYNQRGSLTFNNFIIERTHNTTIE